MNTWKPYPQEEPSCPAKQRASAGIRHSGGFTLIELMIAVAIVGILSSLAAPNYLDFIERARVARSVAELHMIAEVVKGYAMTSGQYPDTLAQAGQNPLLDPWGNPYQYYRIECGTNITVGHLNAPAPPTGGSDGWTVPVDGYLPLHRPLASFAMDRGDSQGLLRLVNAAPANPAAAAPAPAPTPAPAIPAVPAPAAPGAPGPPCGGIGGARKDRFLVPINSDFDLYSIGKDGQSAAPLTALHSHDDVIRASDGGFYGLAKNF